MPRQHNYLITHSGLPVCVSLLRTLNKKQKKTGSPGRHGWHTGVFGDRLTPRCPVVKMEKKLS